MINYIIKTCMQKKEKLTEANVKFSKNELKQDSGFNKVSDGFMDAMYFNFRFTQSGTVNASHPYIIGTYTRDSFYCKHYRDFVKAAEIDVLVISGSPSVRIIELIYPELKGKFKYCGEPVCYEGTMFVSMPHPSRISDKAIADVVNKIAGAYKK